MKLLSFYRLSVLTAILFILLAITLMFAPAQMLSGWGIELTTAVGLVTRRIAALQTGIAVMFFFARNAEHSIARTALIRGIMTTCMILPVLGVYEFSAGHANSGILSAVLIEVALVIAFTYVGCACNNTNRLNKNQGKNMMKALILKRYGKSDQLAFADIPQPTIKPDEILVQVHAVGLNPIDYKIPTGAAKPIIKLQLPVVMGSDLAGVVVEVGNRVTRFKQGDAVFASIFDLGTGSLAEYAVVPENAAAIKPANLDFVQAASIPMVGLTSWQALKERAGLKSGQKVFIPAGSGGIGTFAIQLAKHLGAKVGTTTSTANIDLVKRLGADEIIDYKKQAFEDVLQGYDVVLGTVMGDGIEKSLQILKHKSSVVSLVGPPDAAFARARGMNFLMKFIFSLISSKIIRRAKKVGAEYSFLFVHPDGRQLAEIGKIIEAGHIHPVIDKVFPFDQTKEALAYLEEGRAKGKVVVKVI